ncbi:hypothetical protein [Enterococcus sp. DIV0098]|uniref:hypothetical protein n=1 Tax=Enterococcus sp. DIV0098 TaxID=2774843 RepID=UPI003F20B0FD
MPFFEEAADEFSELLLKYRQIYPDQLKRENMGEEKVIRFLGSLSEPTNAKAIGEALSLSSARISALLNVLEEKNYLTKAINTGSPANRCDFNRKRAKKC